MSPGHLCYVQNTWEATFPLFFPKFSQSTQPCAGGLLPSALHVLAVYERGLEYPHFGVGDMKAGRILLAFPPKQLRAFVQLKSTLFVCRFNLSSQAVLN